MQWNKTINSLPLEEIPVFLKTTEKDSFDNVDVACLLVSDEGKPAWWVGNRKFIKLDGRALWMPICVYDYAIPKRKDNELKEILEDSLILLNSYNQRFKTLYKSMIYSGEGLYALDYFIAGTVNRSLSLIYGFITLIQSQNFLSAAHLIRPLLDNFLRLNAAWLVEKPQEFAMNVWKGSQINKLKDRNNNTLSDRHLKEKAAIEFPWIAKVYNETSGFIHFSNKHILSTMKTDKETPGVFLSSISHLDNDVSNRTKIEAIACMMEISNCIINRMFSYLSTKRVKETDQQ